jgi:hypothetical protein
MVKLIECIERVYILAYKEDTSLIEKAMIKEEFSVEVMRPQYSVEELKYSSASKCLIGHKKIWEECLFKKGLYMVLEADFVPVKGIGQLPLPFDLRKKKKAFGHLYSCAQRIYELDKNKFARGHSSTAVAYVLGAEAAKVLINFVHHEFEKNDPKTYFPWDIYMRMYAQEHGILTYIPFRSYGEHGGIPNPEHKKSGINPVHRADALFGSLYFLPLYAKGSHAIFILCRVIAKLRAVARLITGRYIETAILKNQNISIQEKIRMINFGITRVLTLY